MRERRNLRQYCRMSSRITRDASVKLSYLRPGCPAWSQLTGARAATSCRELTLIGDRPLAMPRNGTFLADGPNTAAIPWQIGAHADKRLHL